MIRTLFGRRVTYVFLGVVMLVTAFTTFSYMGAFLDPYNNTSNVPLAIVNSDAGITSGGTNINYGKQLADKLTATQDGQTYKWTLLSSRDEAYNELNMNKYYAAIIIPDDYSATLASLSTPNPTHAAIIEVLTNPGAGTLASSQSQTVATTVITNLSKTTGDQAIQGLTAAGATISPAAAAIFGNPIQAKITTAVVIGNVSARGMSPFYFALMVTLSSFLGTNILGTLIDLFAEQRRKKGETVTSVNIFYGKAILYSIMAVVVGASVTVVATEMLNMDCPNFWGVLFFAILASLAVTEMSLLFQVTFGRLGLLVGVVFFTILGVPASGGPYPVQMIPDFWRFLNSWLPMRYTTDGTRSLLFLGGNGDAGLSTAIVVLTFYAVFGLITAWLASHLIERHNVWEAADGLMDQILEEVV